VGNLLYLWGIRFGASNHQLYMCMVMTQVYTYNSATRIYITCSLAYIKLGNSLGFKVNLWNLIPPAAVSNWTAFQYSGDIYLENILNICKGALSLHKRTPHLHTRALSLRQNALNRRKRTFIIYSRALDFRERSLHLRERARYLSCVIKDL